MKKIFNTFLIVCFFTNHAFTQSFFDIGLGITLPKIETKLDWFSVNSNQIENRSPIIQLNYCHQIYKKIYSSIGLSYVKVTTISSSATYIPFTSLKFDSYGCKLGVIYQVKSWLFFGVGQAFNFTSKTKAYSYGKRYGELDPFRVELAVDFSIGLIYESFFVESCFNKPYDYLIGKNKDGRYIEPVSFSNFLIGYRFKI